MQKVDHEADASTIDQNNAVKVGGEIRFGDIAQVGSECP